MHCSNFIMFCFHFPFYFHIAVANMAFFLTRLRVADCYDYSRLLPVNWIYLQSIWNSRKAIQCMTLGNKRLEASVWVLPQERSLDWGSCNIRNCHRGLLSLEKNLILVHITTQGRTQWRTPPRFDPRFLLYFHKIVRLTATGLSISPSSKSLCHLFPPKSL